MHKRYAALLGIVLLAAPIQGQEYTPLGQFYANTAGPTSLHLRLPGQSGEYRDWLSWGYDIWDYDTEPQPAPGWLLSEDLTEPPYNLPDDATAVRLHIKAKVAGVTWAPNALRGTLQVMARPAGSSSRPNEMIHATAGKPAGEVGYTPYDLNHVEVDIPLGEDGRIEIFQTVSIIGQYVQVDLVPYVAGYWR